MRRLVGFLFAGLVGSLLSAHELEMESDDKRYYGRSQTSAFHQAISHGDNPFTQEEQAQMDAMTPVNEEGRYYGRFRMNWSKVSVEKIRNTTEQGSQKDFNLVDNRAKKSQRGMEFAIGYIFGDYRLDLEYLLNNNISYAQNPLFIEATSHKLTSSAVKTQAFLMNGFYDFRSVWVRPYIFVTGGISLNKTTAAIATGAAGATGGTGNQSKKAFGLAWGFGVGLRPRIFERWYLDVFYRHTNLGRVKWTPTANGVDNPVTLEGKAFLKGFGLGVNFLF